MIYRKPDYINVGQYDYTGSRPTCTNFVSTNARDVTKTFFHKTETKTKTSVGETETKTKTSVGKIEIETKTFASFLFSVII